MEKKQESTVLLSWGMGSNGSLGNGKKQNEEIPFPLRSLKSKVFVQVSTGTFYTVAITNLGEMFGWGVNTKNRFCAGKEELYEKPVKVEVREGGGERIRSVAAGNWHTIVVDDNRNVYGIGHNKYGQLGLGTFQSAVGVYSKGKVQGCKAVACGNGFSLFLKEDGSVYSAGIKGSHGHEIKEHIGNPKQLPVQNVIKVSAGFTHAACITTVGDLYTWGQGQFYQLGHGSKSDQITPKRVQALHGVSISDVSCSRGQKYSNTIACDTNGIVYTWGSGYKGKLGHAKTWTHENPADEPLPRKVEYLQSQSIRIKQVSAGGIHNIVLSDDGYVYSFGCGSDGRLGHKESMDHVYLYREGFPRMIQSLKEISVTGISSSYYQNSCFGTPRPLPPTQ